MRSIAIMGNWITLHLLYCEGEEVRIQENAMRYYLKHGIGTRVNLGIDDYITVKETVSQINDLLLFTTPEYCK